MAGAAGGKASFTVGNSDRQSAEAIVVEQDGSTTLARLAQRKVSYEDPAYAYLIARTTDKSRSTCVESMRRIARVTGAPPGDREAWKRIPWTRLTHAETNVIRSELIRLHKPATVRLTLTVLRGVLKKAFALGLIPAEQYQRAILMDRVTGKSAPPGRALPQEDIEALRAHCASLPQLYGAMLQAILSVGLGAGMRREEMANLTLAGVSESELRFMGKGRKEAVQPIVDWAAVDLRAWLEERPVTLRVPTVFVKFNNDKTRCLDQALTPGRLWSYLGEAWRAVGIKRFSPHDLRRTYATRLLATGQPAKAQKLMRHANSSTTLGYDRSTEEQAKEILTAIDSMGPKKSAVESLLQANVQGLEAGLRAALRALGKNEESWRTIDWTRLGAGNAKKLVAACATDSVWLVLEQSAAFGAVSSEKMLELRKVLGR